MPGERLAKVIAATGLTSRRQAEEWIRAGRVAVNGQTVREVALRVDPHKDEVTVDGKPLPRVPHRYLLYYKPPGVVTTRSDPHARRTVLQAIGPAAKGLHPVGRLDKASEGLLLLTNDGQVTLVLTHPRYQVEKTYWVWTECPLRREDWERLKRGVPLEDGWVHLRRVQRVATPEGWAVEVVVAEGRKREIRRLFAALGHRVVRLRRVQMGPLRLGALQPGQWRWLSPREVNALKEWVAQAQERAKGEPPQTR